jgi:heme exporter protein A
MDAPSLSFTDVACTRGGRLLWHGVSFACAPGDAVVVTGPNGAGKSSLIRIAAELLAPAAGAVAVRGARALLAEAGALDGEHPLMAALRFWARLDGVPDPGGRVATAMAAFDLGSLAAVPVRLLSTGQRRRATLARVVATAAPLWLLDEPANGLDATSVQRLEGSIAGHRAMGGIALVATHLPLAIAGAREIRL